MMTIGRQTISSILDNDLKYEPTSGTILDLKCPPLSLVIANQLHLQALIELYG